MQEITATIWKTGTDCYQITVNDYRYRRRLDTAIITDINILFECMKDISETLKEEQNANVLFKIKDNSHRF